MRVKMSELAVGLESRGRRCKTTLLDLLAGLIDRAKNDAAAMQSARQVFARYDVRLARTLAPLRLATASHPSRKQLKRPAAKPGSNWA